MSFSVNDTVRLKTFFGTTKPQDEIYRHENYWKLIGACGRVIRKREIFYAAQCDSETQFLVQFHDDLDMYNLHWHNEERNSLWIVHSDLEPFDVASTA